MSCRIVATSIVLADSRNLHTSAFSSKISNQKLGSSSRAGGRVSCLNNRQLIGRNEKAEDSTSLPPQAELHQHRSGLEIIIRSRRRHPIPESHDALP